MSGFDRKLDPSRSVRRVEIISGPGGRRQWSADEKEQILEETLAPGAVVSEVARRHGLRPQQVFGWRREARIEPQAATLVPAFLPVVVEAEPPAPVTAPAKPKRHRRAAHQPVAWLEREIDDIAVQVP